MNEFKKEIQTPEPVTQMPEEQPLLTSDEIKERNECQVEASDSPKMMAEEYFPKIPVLETSEHPSDMDNVKLFKIKASGTAEQAIEQGKNLLKDAYTAVKSPTFRKKARGYLSNVGCRALGACHFSYFRIKEFALGAKTKIKEEGIVSFGKEIGGRSLDAAAGIGVVIIDKSKEGLSTAYENKQKKGLTEYTKEVTCKGIDAIAEGLQKIKNNILEPPFDTKEKQITVGEVSQNDEKIIDAEIQANTVTDAKHYHHLD